MFYPESQERIPRNITEALGKYIVIKAYLDDNNSKIMENCRLYYVIIIYGNNAPIIWYIKCYNTVEPSSFASEFSTLNRYG